MEAIISKKVIEGKEIYRIHHIMEDQLIGVEAVEKTEDATFRKVLNWNDGGEIEEYMNELEDIVIVEEDEQKAVLAFLENFPVEAKKELEETLEKEGAKVSYFLSTSYAYFAIVEQEARSKTEDGSFYQAYKVILDRYGKLKAMTPIEEQADFEILLGHLTTELGDNERTFFQFNQFETCGLKRTGNEIDFLFIRTVVDEEEDGKEKFLSSPQQVHTLMHEVGSSELTIKQEREKTEEECGEFIIEMLAVLSQSEPDSVVKH